MYYYLDKTTKVLIELNFEVESSLRTIIEYNKLVGLWDSSKTLHSNNIVVNHTKYERCCSLKENLVRINDPELAKVLYK